jgi:glucan endo-1,3-beta-D-glucosidase
MPSLLSILAVATSVLSTANAGAVMGFNSASTKSDGSPKMQADFEAEFRLAAGLQGAPGTFNSVRLYTNIQGATPSDPISAFPAAIATNTTLLLGIWTSGTDTIQPELDALNNAINQYGDSLAKLVVGLAVGSEDLYRNSVTGVANKAGIGAQPDVVANFINQAKKSLAGTALSSVPVGHVDTYNVWGNASNAAVLEASDFLGIDVYPFYENDQGDNSIDNALSLWNAAMVSAQAAAGSKPIWITETGWPASGANWGQAVPSVDNAKQYWDQIGCQLFGINNTWWYVLEDQNPSDTANFSVSADGTETPVWNLTCPIVDKTTTTPNPSGSGSGTGSGSPSSTSSGAKASGSKPSGASTVLPQTLVSMLLVALVAASIL